ncbi:hypothetical protein TKK_0009749 [Trichogramma kaykai]|uniref:FAD dependent oxidoreductase domain-containing protein n=1 Tax=Trichogramma kaykai TaxID=54128 RepID=A0ABD2X091_9HYME
MNVPNHIAIVGAGVIGVTSALAVQQAFPAAEVTIFSEIFSPYTTGDGSAGLWSPFVLENTDPTKILRWSTLTHRWMENFWKKGLAADIGLCLLPLYRVTHKPEGYPLPDWASAAYGAYELSDDELESFNRRHKSKYGGAIHFVTYTCESTKLLPWLMEKFKQSNGKIVERKIQSLENLYHEGYDVIINCTGMGSRDLLKDESLVPVRGQVTRVKGPWLFEVMLEEDGDGNYVIPNVDSAILGGTRQKGDFDISVREDDLSGIREGCERLYPSINKCQELTHWVGLRPVRKEVRLEKETVSYSDSKNLTIIHNYGHGGSGVTLCWGCAMDVVQILQQYCEIKNLSKK